MNKPPEWNIGTAVKISSAEVRPNAVITLSALNVMFSCVKVAPFGRPVVPEVNRIRTGAARSGPGSVRTRSAPSAQVSGSAAPANITTRSCPSWPALARATPRNPASATTSRGRVAARKTRSSAAGIRMLNGTKMAPMRAQANSSSRSSGQFGPR
jgi:hypothetical protein